MSEIELINQLKSGILVFSQDYQILDYNPSCLRLLGLAQQAKAGDFELLGEKWQSLIETMKSADFKQKLSEKAHGFSIQKQLNSSYLNFHFSSLKDARILIEISKVEQQDISKTTHELKRPIQNIKTLTETLLMGAKDDPQVASKYLQNIFKESERLGKLVNDVLKLNYLASSEPELKLVSCDIKELVQTSMDSLEDKAKTLELSLINQLDSFKQKIDRELFLYALENLLDNAVKYNKKNGEVIVSSPSKNTLLIKDTGLGMSETELEKLGQDYFRAKSAEGITGTGLGVSLVKKILDLHGIELKVKSEINNGSEFILQF